MSLRGAPSCFDLTLSGSYSDPAGEPAIIRRQPEGREDSAAVSASGLYPDVAYQYESVRLAAQHLLVAQCFDRIDPKGEENGSQGADGADGYK